jgi:hypothetical protein
MCHRISSSIIHNKARKEKSFFCVFDENQMKIFCGGFSFLLGYGIMKAEYSLGGRMRMQILDIITKKKLGQPLTREEITYFAVRRTRPFRIISWRRC